MRFWANKVKWKFNRIFSLKRKEKTYATGNQKKSGEEARQSAHRQRQLQHLRLAIRQNKGGGGA